MIICRTPFRVSFFGGGTDYPEWFAKHSGAVLASTIDKYCYLTCRFLPPFFEHRIRVVWSKIENCRDIEEVTHPAVKAVIKHLQLERCLEIHHIGDLPARSGMGSSSAFTVGLLNALHGLQGQMMTKYDLAREAIFIEQEKLKEAVGSQDQVSAAFGGLNHISFLPNGEFSVVPVTLSKSRREELESHLMMFFTGINRTSTVVSEQVTRDLANKERELLRMRELVEEATKLLAGPDDLTRFGELLSEGWNIKRGLAALVSNGEVDDQMRVARRAGALGGKLTGAGGGGFLLLFVPPERQGAVREALKQLLYVPIKFEFSGSQIIFADHDADYTAEEKAREGQRIIAFKELEQMIAQIPGAFPTK